MQSVVYQKLMRIGRWQRVLAALLLGMAFFDLAVIDVVSPQLCDDGFLSATNFVPAHAAVEGIGEKVVIEVAIDVQDFLPQQEEHSEAPPTSTDEDCFCCCSHILPGYAFDAGPMWGGQRANVATVCSLPSAPPQDTFHPPRFA